MPIFTHRHIKDQAEELLKHFDISRPPVDVRKIAKGLGLEIIEMTQDTWFYGMLLGFHDECYIVINKLFPEEKKRFTIAHELGHYQLHRTNMAYSTAKEKEYLHREADIFASELSIPTRLVRRYAAEWYNDHRVLAGIFGVTEAAMVEKLDELGLVKKARFNWNFANPRHI
ncbi:MAG: ImmA/IrrE family metallo-endopeptidase [Actinobacteria bacterium]|nr:ImmA/IrrE family metallo-endopeptidase [Actinomycetota bacterium]